MYLYIAIIGLCLIRSSSYQIRALKREDCRFLCTIELKPDQHGKVMRKLRERIREEYRIHWLLDGLPGATVKTFQDAKGETRTLYEDGFPLGVKDSRGEVYINNHVTLKIRYHATEGEPGIQIVAFEVYPESIRHERGGGDQSKYLQSCSTRTKQLVDTKQPLSIVYTYSVDFVRSDVPWKSRWDHYLQMVDRQIHWFSIVNSLMIGMTGPLAELTTRARSYDDLLVSFLFLCLSFCFCF